MRLTLPRERYPGDAAGAFFDRLAERLAAAARACAPCRPRRSFRRRASFGTQFRLERGQAERRRRCRRRSSPRRRRATSRRLACRFGRARFLSATDRLDTPLVAIVNQAFARAVSRRRRSDRAAADDRQPGSAATVDDDRRCRRRLSKQRHDATRAPGDLRSGPAADRVEPAVHAHPHRRIAGGAAAVRAPGGLVARSRTARLLIQTLDEALADVVVSAAHLGAPARHLCRASRWCSRRSASTASCPTRSARGRRRWACGLRVGAQRRDVVWLVLGQVLRLSAIGLAIGIVVLVFAGRALEGLLFGVRAADPLTIAAGHARPGAVALVAAWAPGVARQPGRSDSGAPDTNRVRFRGSRFSGSKVQRFTGSRVHVRVATEPMTRLNSEPVNPEPLNP